MFKNLFKKKFPAKKDIPIDQPSWKVQKGNYDGNPIFVRVNLGFKDIIGHPEFPFRVGIAIPIKGDWAEENKKLSPVEDEIFELFESDKESLVPLVISMPHLKEFVIYSSSDKDLNKKIEILKNKYPQYDFQNYVTKDPKWLKYKEFYKK